MKYLLMSAAMLLLVTGCKLGNGKNREEVCETDMTRAGQEIKNDSVANIADSIRLYFTYPLPDGTEYGYTFPARRWKRKWKPSGKISKER